jgi:dynein heavy chain
LCFSPIGESLRNRIRNFPSLVNCTTIDWFSEWPADALNSVAKRFLATVEMETKVRDSCTEMVKYFHETTVNSSTKFLLNLKRHYYVTPTSYLELISTFKKLLKDKREEILGLKDRYENGYECLITTEGEVSGMQKYLEELKPQLIETSKLTDEKMVKVTHEKGEADVIAAKVSAEEAEAQKIADHVSSIKEDCEKELNKAMPVLESAQKALNCITPQDISYIRKLGQPPDDVRMVLEAVCVLQGRKPKRSLDPNTQKVVYDYWATSKQMMNEGGFLKSLLDYKKEDIEQATIDGLQKYMENPKFTYDHLTTVSEIAANLCKWVIAMNDFYNVNLIVKPKQIALAKATKEKNEVMAELAIKQRELKEVLDKVQALEDDLNITKAKKEDLENQVEDCTQKLDRAQKLIGGLGGEKKRWSETAANLKIVYKNLTGDVLISSGMIAYLGAFTSAYRSELTTDWVQRCINKEIPSSGKFNLNTVLGDAVAIRNWTICGLPSDQFSVENGIITSKARRWPLFIDPQGQANKWIRNMEKERKIDIIKFSDGNYMRSLENAIQFGKPVLLENVGEDLDPSIEPLLQKQIFKKGASYNIRFGDTTIEYSQDFNFYITTKLRNPHYLPETSTKVTLINFMITYEGLTDQLLGILVAKEKPDLEMEKEKLVINGAKNKNKLQEIEDQILKTLQNSENILADSKGVKILSDAKVLSDKIQKEQAEAEIVEKEIDEGRLEYKPVALKTSGLFFCITDLANIDPMYQYSLTFFVFLFTTAIQNSEQSDEIEQRLKFLNEEFLYSLYRNICRSLFEKDKLIFSFLLNIKLMELSEELENDEWRFFLTGGISLGDQLPDCPAKWLEEKSWGELCRLSKLPAFKGLLETFDNHVEEFHNMYESQNPQEMAIPGGWEAKLNRFQKMIIIRCIRPDKVIPCVFNFVKDNLGDKYIDPPPFDLSAIYKDSSSTTPLIFVLSPGSDPLQSLLKFAELKKKQLTTVSLGQGQGPIAQRHIKEGVLNGQWVVLQNCHLAVSWMGTLEKICEDLSPDPKKTNREFRLWLTSYPSKDFPVSVLQNGVKMTNEPPKGLRSNLVGSYNIDPISNPVFFDSCKKPKEWRKLLFGLCFFHAIIQERRKFGPLGWNIPYEFNESDLRISVRQLQMFLNEYPDKIPFDALKYLSGECNYGGRVTDDKDRRLIMCILEDFFTDKIFDDNYKFSPSGIFYVPKTGSYESYIEYIKSLPMSPLPEVFGLHENADITKDRNETGEMFTSILSTQTNESGGESASIEDTVIEVATKILADFPKEYDIRSAEEKFPVSYEQSMNTVLTQELQRFNGLIKVIRSSLNDLKKAIAGEILLSSELEAAMHSLFDGRVPEMWKAKSFPSLKPLGGYVTDTRQRLVYFKKWIDQGIPSLFHISKFFFTQGFLTGALQNYARKTKIPIDELEFDFEVIQEDNPVAPVDGINIVGLFLEGCRWDEERRLLGESKPKILFEKCPIMWLNPGKIKNMKQFPHYYCPVYKTSARRGVLSTTGHSTNYVMSIKLPTDQPQSHWIKRGVAMLTQLDD